RDACGAGATGATSPRRCEGWLTMGGLWRDLMAGGRQARWSVYFALYLVPLLAAAVLLALVTPGGWHGDPATPPGPAGLVLIALALVAGLFLAARRDGPKGWLGGPMSRIVPFGRQVGEFAAAVSPDIIREIDRIAAQND